MRDDGLSTRVVNTGEPIAVENAATTALDINPRMFRDPITAGLCLPLLVAGKPIGVVWFLYDRPRIFPQSDIEALQLFVNQAAVAYHDARRMRQLSLLYQAAQAMAGREKPREVLTQIARSARLVLQADSAAIWSYDQIRNVFIPDEFVGDGIPDEDLLRFRKDEPSPGGTAHTVMERGWVSVPDIKGPEVYSFLGQSTRACCAAFTRGASRGWPYAWATSRWACSMSTTGGLMPSMKTNDRHWKPLRTGRVSPQSSSPVCAARTGPGRGAVGGPCHG